MIARRRPGRRVAYVIVAVVLASAVLVALAPSILAPYLSARLSMVLGVPVHVAWVTWNPFASRIVLHRMTLALAPRAPSVITMRALTADVALRRLFAGDLVLTRLAVNEPWVSLRRTANGDVDLGAVLAGPASGSPVTPSASGSEIAVRSVIVQHLRITGGSVEFRDETTTPALSTSLQLDDVSADDLEMAFSGRAHVQLDLASRFEQAPLRLTLAYRARGDDSRLKVDLKTSGISLARTLFYMPLGWREASGTLDAGVTYTREIVAGRLRTHTLTGHAIARDVALADPGASEPRVRAKRARVGNLDVDLVGRRTTIRAIDVEGFQAVVARDGSGVHIPFVTVDEGGADTSWTTVMGAVTFTGGEILLRDVIRGADPELRAAVRTGTLRTERDGAVHLVLRTSTSAGAIDLDGRFDDRSGRVRLALHDLSLPELAERLRLPVRFATGTVGGMLEADVGGVDAPRLSGELRLPGGRTLPVDPASPTDVLAWQDLSVDVAEARLAPARVRIRRLEAEWPYAMLHRTTHGVFPVTLVTGAGSREPAADTRDADGGRAGPTLTVEDLAFHHGRLEFYDTTLQPPYWTELTDSELRATTVAYAPFTAAQLDLGGAVDEISPLHASGTVDETGARVDLAVEQLRLAPLNPYVEPILQYAITSGAARIVSRVTLTGPHLEAANDVVLSRFGLARTGEDHFQRDLGAPLSVTLALMKDYRGEISLSLPIQGDLGKGEYEVRDLFSTALTQALLGAVRSPVTLLGSIFRRDEEERFDLKPIPFPPGSADLAADGGARIDEIARLLSRHEQLDVVLVGDPSPADAAALGATQPTDPVPTDRLTALAAARLRTVVERLVGTQHVAPTRIVQIPWTASPLQPETVPGIDVQLRGK